MLALLAALYGVNSIDRQVMSVIVEPLKRSLHLSDAAVGALAGPVYAVSYAAASLPLGWLVDRVHRSRMLAAILAIWSGLTLVCGFVPGFVGLALARMGVGAAEAGASPACQSVISDYFRPKERAFAIGLFYFSTAVGVCASFLIGGLVVGRFGWRAAFWVAGAPGLLLSLLIWTTVREPVRGALDHVEATGAEARRVLRRLREAPALIHLTAGMTLTSLVMTAMWTWASSVLVRGRSLSVGHAGLLIALAAVFAAAGSPLAGRLAQRLAGAEPRRLALTPTLGCLACIPFGVLFALAPSTSLALTGLFGAAFFSTAWLGPAFAASMTLVNPEGRGLVASGIQFTINLVGVSLGPLITGALSDRLGVRPALAIVFLFDGWAALHFLLAMRSPAGRNPAR